MTDLQQQIKTKFPEYPFLFDLLMANKTYFKIGGPAEAYVELRDKKKISELVLWCKEEEISFRFFGGGSNVLVSDEGIKGVVIKLIHSDVEFLEEEDNQGKFLIGAGAKTSLAVRTTVDGGYTGLEYFLGVPGNIGGAIYNNAHYLEDLIGEHILRVEVLNENGEFSWLSNEECEFGYDSSRFQKTKEIIYQAEFILEKGDRDTSLDLIKKATEYRAETQPLGLPSSGCIFQNVPNTPELKKKFPKFAEKQYVPGGFLIDQAGLKGEKEGEIEVSKKHAAFFVNHGGGTAVQVKKLIDRVKSAVADKFNVNLKEEVFWLD